MKHLENFKPFPCPFCGCETTTFLTDYPHRIVCGNVGCRAIGPDHYFMRLTRDAWNERAPSPANQSETPSDGAIYAAVSQKGMTEAERQQFRDAIDTSLSSHKHEQEG